MACRPFNPVAIMMIAGTLVGALAPAQATTLLDLEDPLSQTTPFALTFTGSSTSTAVTFEGYQVPAHEQTTQIGLFLNGTGPNLLGGSWVFTAAPSASDANTIDDGTSVPALNFAGGDEDSFDMFSQTIATSVGGVYTLDFLFSNSINNQPSGLIVDASDASSSSAAPIPAALPLFATGLLGLISVGRRRRKKQAAKLAAA
jgi:hypothetical protein